MSWAKAALSVVVDHRVAAVLDHDEGPAEALEPRQRLDERLRLGLGDAQRGGVDRAAQGLLGGCHRCGPCVGLVGLSWSRRSSRGRSRG